MHRNRSTWDFIIYHFMIMKEISIQEYHSMRNEAWDMMVKTKMVEDKDDNWLDFDESYYSYLVRVQGYTIHHD